MAGARGLWRATGMKDGDFGKPIIAVANSFTQFVPGHVHLKDLGQLVAREIEAAGGVAKEFNTIAVDDGIAMGHDGMLYSLPSRELIADSVEYMVNAHCADAMVCISNCDKITPGMLMAALRLNIPTVFVSGGPMEAGKVKHARQDQARVDLIDAMVAAADTEVTDAEVAEIERSACPTCGSCSGMFTANSMNCLTEALGLALPGNGTVLATHADRKRAVPRSRPPRSSSSPAATTSRTTARVLPRAIASFDAFENAMTLDIAMGGSTNTVLHLLAAAHEAEVDFTMQDIDRLSRRVPLLCKVAPVGRRRAYRGRAPRRRHHGASWASWTAPGCCTATCRPCTRRRLGEALDALGHQAHRQTTRCSASIRAAPGGIPTTGRLQPGRAATTTLDADRERGVIRDVEHAFSKDGGLAVLYGNLAEDGCIVKTAGVDASHPDLRRPGPGLREPGRSRSRPSWATRSQAGDVVLIRYEGPSGGPGMQEMLYPTSYLKSKGLGKACALITDGRFSGGTLRPVDRPCLAGSGRRRR